jgi:septum formation protein
VGPMPVLVLASTSPARRALLAQVGLSFEAVSPEVPEPLVREADPVAQARAFALAKALAVAARRPGAIVIGADQVLAFEGEAWGKPGDAGEALRQLERLAGKAHALVTAIAVIGAGGEAWVEHETSTLTVRTLSAEERAAYVATGEWEGCAGGYRLEGRGLALLERIEGDHTNVLGLPMPRLLTRLRAMGVPLFGPGGE